MVIINKLIKQFQIEYHPESTMLFRTNENIWNKTIRYTVGDLKNFFSNEQFSNSADEIDFIRFNGVTAEYPSTIVWI